MPELPDLTIYLEHLNQRLAGKKLVKVHLASPFVLRSVTPGVDAFADRRVVSCKRLAKQLVLGFEDDFFMVIHLMISGRLQWADTFKPPPKRLGLAAFEFENGTLLFTEASKKKRASLRLIEGQAALEELDPGGLEVLQIDRPTFIDRIRESNHTLKRALTDQHVFAGIGNAYSDEILLRAMLSPFKRPSAMKEPELEVLYNACCEVLKEWCDRLREENGSTFPKKVTAFHDQMAVHGKYKQPCPVCGSPVQRIVYAENEANYCAKCQTGSRLLADRSLSRLLKDNWPKRLEDLEG
ncbi:MAG: formamidopyrimidine-DNA glycosylase [Proteobacteria bacterium]|nr:formamidopyrimidine-DNA glycosylase [Pseudomonadota bacterium]